MGPDVAISSVPKKRSRRGRRGRGGRGRAGGRIEYTRLDMAEPQTPDLEEEEEDEDYRLALSLQEELDREEQGIPSCPLRSKLIFLPLALGGATEKASEQQPPAEVFTPSSEKVKGDLSASPGHDYDADFALALQLQAELNGTSGEYSRSPSASSNEKGKSFLHPPPLLPIK